VFCDNAAFVPKTTIIPGRRGWEQRLNDQKKRMVSRYGAHRFLVYFQSGTSTYGDGESLSRVYSLAARQERAAGMIISTRPDYVSDEIVTRILEAVPASMDEIWIELGLQSAHERSLEFLGRGHDVAAYDTAVETIHRVGAGRIKVAAHLIVGIPGETAADAAETARYATRHPAVQGIKIHHLQVHRGTPLAERYRLEPFALPDEDAYIVILGGMIRILPPRIVVMRFFTTTQSDRLIAPQWESSTAELLKKLEEYCEKNTITQGCGRNE
jgi:hypothetical protein